MYSVPLQAVVDYRYTHSLFPVSSNVLTQTMEYCSASMPQDHLSSPGKIAIHWNPSLTIFGITIFLV